MQDSVLAIWLLLATLVLWVSLPLLPAVLIYRLFPETKVGLTGPLAGLTLNAGGAFAAYFATLITCVLALNHIWHGISGLSHSYYTLNADLIVEDHNAQKLSTPQDGITMSFSPRTVTVSGDELQGIVPKLGDQWPVIRIDIKGAGARSFKLDHRHLNFDVDEDSHTINVHEPIVVRQPEAISAGSTGGQ